MTITIVKIIIILIRSYIIILRSHRKGLVDTELLAQTSSRRQSSQHFRDSCSQTQNPPTPRYPALCSSFQDHCQMTLPGLRPTDAAAPSRGHRCKLQLPRFSKSTVCIYFV